MCASYIGFGDEWRVKLVPAGRELTYPLLVKILTQEKKNKSGGGGKGEEKKMMGGAQTGYAVTGSSNLAPLRPERDLRFREAECNPFQAKIRMRRRKKFFFAHSLHRLDLAGQDLQQKSPDEKPSKHLLVLF